MSIYRWKSRRLRAVASNLYWDCIATSCERWPRRALRFEPRAGAWWDRRRGVAIGGERPWLIARSSDAGRTWEIVDASPVPLRRPRTFGPGRASIVMLRCLRRNCPPAYVAHTSNYGTSWWATAVRTR